MPHDHNAIERAVEARQEMPVISAGTKHLLLTELRRMHDSARADARIEAGHSSIGTSPVRLAAMRLEKISQALREVEALPVRP